MIKQVWDKLTIRTNEPEFIAGKLVNNSKVRNVRIEKDKVIYEQATWRQEDVNHTERSE